MDKDILKGFKISLGFIFGFALLGLVYAVGFHIAEEILPGTFTGDFEFNGSVNFTNANVSGIGSGITLGIEQASTSGTSIDFTGIPSGTKRITVMLSGVSTNGGNLPILQIGDSGGIETSSYVSGSIEASAPVSTTSGFLLTATLNSGHNHDIVYVLNLQNSTNNNWLGSGISTRSSDGAANIGSGSKSLSSELDRLRLTIIGGVDAFDAGTINIQYE